MPALEPLPGVRVVADPAALDARALGPARRARSCGSRPTTRFAIGADRRSTSTTPHAIVEPERRLRRRAGSTPRRRGGATSSGRSPAERPALAQGVDRRRAGQALARRTTARRWSDHRRGLRRRARRRWLDRLPMSEYTDTLLDDPLARRPAEVGLRRRDHRRRRARPVDRLLPRDPPRHHERRRPRGRLHRVGQHRPQHDDHPRQLRHPRGDPLLPALARAVPGPRGGDRRRRSSTRPRASSGSPTPRWRCGPSARALPDEHGLRREDVHASPRPSSRSSSRRST